MFFHVLKTCIEFSYVAIICISYKVEYFFVLQMMHRGKKNALKLLVASMKCGSTKDGDPTSYLYQEYEVSI